MRIYCKDPLPHSPQTCSKQKLRKANSWKPFSIPYSILICSKEKPPGMYSTLLTSTASISNPHPEFLPKLGTLLLPWGYLSPLIVICHLLAISYQFQNWKLRELKHLYPNNLRLLSTLNPKTLKTLCRVRSDEVAVICPAPIQIPCISL